MSDLLSRLRKRSPVLPVLPVLPAADSLDPGVLRGVLHDVLPDAARSEGGHAAVQGSTLGSTPGSTAEPRQTAIGSTGSTGSTPPCPRTPASPLPGAQPEVDPRTRPAPRVDAPGWQWDQYFAQERRIIREDGRAEVETFGTMVPKSQLMNHSSRTRREVAEYLREFRPGPDTPDDPCQCGDTVFYKLTRSSQWRCRSCEPPNPHLEVSWFVQPRTIGDASRVTRARPDDLRTADQSISPAETGHEEDVL